MSSQTQKSAVPPTIPGSGKYKSLETNDFRVNNTLNVVNLLASGFVQGNIITDGVASMSGGTLTNLNVPIAASDAVNKAYVDAILGGTWLGPVLAASTGDLTLSGEQTIDGIAVVTGDRVLAKNQSTGSENGIYVVDTGVWSRSSDLPIGSSAGNTILAVNQGVVNESRIYQCNNFVGSDVVGTDNLIYVQLAGSDTSPGGADTNVQFNNAGTFGGSNNFTWNGTLLDITGDITSSGNITCTQLIATSDATLKKDVEPIDNALSILNLFDPVQYKFNHNNDNQLHYGILAQDLQDQGLDNLVHNVNGYLGVNYNDIIGILIASIQELKDEIYELKHK